MKFVRQLAEVLLAAVLLCGCAAEGRDDSELWVVTEKPPEIA